MPSQRGAGVARKVRRHVGSEGMERGSGCRAGPSSSSSPCCFSAAADEGEVKGADEEGTACSCSISALLAASAAARDPRALDRASRQIAAS